MRGSLGRVTLPEAFPIRSYPLLTHRAPPPAHDSLIKIWSFLKKKKKKLAKQRATRQEDTDKSVSGEIKWS